MNRAEEPTWRGLSRDNSPTTGTRFVGFSEWGLPVPTPLVDHLSFGGTPSEPLEPRQLLAVTLLEPTELPTQGSAVAALVINLDGGAPELLMAESTGLAMYSNGQRQTLSTAVNFTNLLVDVDGDGDSDLVTSRDGRLSLLLQDGSRPFSPQVHFVSDAWYSDLNADGQLDVISSRRLMGPGAPTVLTIALSDPAGGIGDFEQQGILTAPADLAAADMDGDGDIDLVTESAVLLNDGQGRFSHDRRIIFGGLPLARQVVTADFNGDQRMDWAIAAPAIRHANGILEPGSLRVYTNTTTGGVLSFTQAVFANPSPTPTITVADLNADTRLDILLAGFTSSIAGQPPPDSGAMAEVYFGDVASGFERAAVARMGAGPNDPAAWRILGAGNLQGDSAAEFIGARPGVIGIFQQGQVTGPRLGAMSFSPGRATFGLPITISVAEASGSSAVQSVSFYRDSNGNSILDTTDQFLGTDSSSGGWSIRTRADRAWGERAVTMFAVATDAQGNTGESVGTVEALPQRPPVIQGIAASVFMQRLWLGGMRTTVLLEPQEASDPNGALREVRYYVDRNHNNIIDRRDVLVRPATAQTGFRATIQIHPGWLRGTLVRFIGVARDRAGLPSAPVFQMLDLWTPR